VRTCLSWDLSSRDHDYTLQKLRRCSTMQIRSEAMVDQPLGIQAQDSYIIVIKLRHFVRIFSPFTFAKVTSSTRKSRAGEITTSRLLIARRRVSVRTDIRCAISAVSRIRFFQLSPDVYRQGRRRRKTRLKLADSFDRGRSSLTRRNQAAPDT